MTDPRIESRARALLTRAAARDLPIDVQAIAEFLGITVELADLGEEVSGMLVREPGGALIGVNWSHHSNRQRFTIAHEIGHHELHEGGTFIDKGVTVRLRSQKNLGSGTDEEEQEANAFAAALLMPREAVHRELQSETFDPSDERELRAFSDRFGVSSQAMLIRLQDLGLLET